MRSLLSVSIGAIVAVAFTGFPAAAQTAEPAKRTAPEAVVYDAPSAMAFFKTLAGDWQAGAGHEHGGSGASNPSSLLTFRTKAAGSAIVQTTRLGQPGEMESVFHMDGDKLLLTHYCALQNAPVLEFQKSSKPGEIKFVFKGGTNFDPKVDAHFHEGTFQVRDKDTVEQTFTVYANGKPTPEGRSVLRRRAGN
ncbi:MAG: hypothetical protein FJW27_06115 [Acidimicrobiia bacterium]|nr:hypothetical protein [Acidimicrobiia bacterium]